MPRSLYLYNTASREKELFTPLHDVVGLYCCGPTVYNFAHIGNLRTYIFEDVLRRTLLSAGYKLKHVVNITDVGHLVSDSDTGEDKMERGARREGKSVWDLAAFYTAKFMQNLADLNIQKPEVLPKATDHLPQMIAMVQELEAKGYTYRTNDGIYFDTLKFPAYADFARLDPESIRPGERVHMGAKRTPTDFALWKFSPANVKRQMEWESPWGVGFPGWHIECSAMSLAYLPQPIDIHTGGTDHVRIHHTNEIAQAEAATGRKFVRYWMHGEFLVLDQAKMAKSGGNFITLDKLKTDGVDPLAYRLFCFSAHYGSPLNYSPESMKAASTAYGNLRKSFAPKPGAPVPQPVDENAVSALLENFYAAVYDDLNMPKAMAALWEIAHSEGIPHDLKRAAAARADEILGLNLLAPIKEEHAEEYPGDGGVIKIMGPDQWSEERKSEILAKVRIRQKARREKDWGMADTMRKELTALGISVKDLSDGSAEVRA